LRKLVTAESLGVKPLNGIPQSNARIQLNETRRGLDGVCGLECVHEIMRIDEIMTDSQLNRNIRANAAGKRAVNLSLSKDVLIAAKELGVNISEVCDSHLRKIVRGELQRRWKVDHAEFIAAYNETVDKEGLPLEQWRGF
jgi:antitoxin CcdA